MVFSMHLHDWWSRREKLVIVSCCNLNCLTNLSSVFCATTQMTRGSTYIENIYICSYKPKNYNYIILVDPDLLTTIDSTMGFLESRSG